MSRLADFYDIDPEELWTLADYHIATRLRSFTTYLRSRYDFPPEAIAELGGHFDYLKQGYAKNDQGKKNTKSKN